MMSGKSVEGLVNILRRMLKRVLKDCKYTFRAYEGKVLIWSSDKYEMVYCKIDNKKGFKASCTFRPSSMSFLVKLRAKSGVYLDEVELEIKQKGKTIYMKRTPIGRIYLSPIDKLQIEFQLDLTGKEKM